MEKKKALSRAPQRRTIERVSLLLDSACDLLLELNVDEISLADISNRADIPLPSIYHFFPNKVSLFAALAQRCHQEIAACIDTYMPHDALTWQDFIECILKTSVEFLNSNPAVMKLFLGAGVSAEVRKADVVGNQHAARKLAEVLSGKFALSDGLDVEMKMAISFAISDGVWQLSYAKHGRISDEFVVEGVRASIAYLRSYFPEFMARRVVERKP
ncbi:TetR/AcrR family transcriptional regulator [Pseudomonas nabeulensis]|uniref:TetR/AcrR family transcriptional regulator n=1 Tax=Pseudomonas nabeulensis TaxID=2293833 RepID=A0A4Z0AGH5_9PSED|nr:TetR/AcrR family transcriptional regulator [Pseudomonas nabeulensis]TFY85520.1 TetR/AcrR family transcriptional regulator [Pseudomonas nabeulensis]